MTYNDIMSLDRRALGRAVCQELFGEPDPSERSNPAARWKGFGRVMWWLMNQPHDWRVGWDFDRKDAYFSILLEGKWIGMRGPNIMVCGCRAALMIKFEAWPANYLVNQTNVPG